MPTFGKPAKGAVVATEEEAAVPSRAREAAVRDAAETERDAEVRRRQERVVRGRLEILYEAEERRARWSEREVQGRWLDLLRREKLEELQGEVEVLALQHDRAVARRMATLEMLLRDLDEQEEQHRVAARSHLEDVDVLLELHRHRIAALAEGFGAALATLRGDFDAERRHCERQFREEAAELRSLLAALREEGEGRAAELHADATHQRDEAQEKHTEEQNLLRQQLETEILDLQQTINHEHDRYMTTAEEKMRQYQELTQRDSAAAERIGQQQRKAQRLQDGIAHGRAELAHTTRECEERNRALREEKDATARHFSELKAKMQRWRRLQDTRLSELVVLARDARKELEGKTRAAERILRLSEQCRALEEEGDRHLPPPLEGPDAVKLLVAGSALDHSEGDAADAASDVADVREPSETPNPMTEDWAVLERFWLKYNRVVVDAAAAAQEKQRLLEENARLQAALKEYLEGVSVSEAVMGGPNALLMASTFKHTGKPAPGDRSGLWTRPVLEAHVLLNNTQRQLQPR